MWMQSDTVLEVAGVSKIYSRSQASTRARVSKALSRILWGLALPPTKELNKGEFWSLKDINFNLKRGEALGVIGLNGAGKTTLLRILAGQILPDQGEIRMLGRSSAMIDLTAGFQMSASGARNIYLRGAMLGRSKEEVAATYEEIIDFAELGEAINAPVSTYSSGMLMRLAFSIMVAAKPEVLFIDEILSVGDFRFRQKCLAKIRELREKSAFVLVSHSMNDIKNFCNHAICLDKGQIIASGDPKDVINCYEEMQVPKFVDTDAKKTEILKPQFHNNDAIKEIEHYWCDADGKAITEIHPEDDLYFKVIVKVKHAPRNLILGVPVWREDGVYVTGFSTETQNTKLHAEAMAVNTFLLKIPSIGFNPGIYMSNFGMVDGLEFLYRGENPRLTVLSNDKKSWGMISLPHKWHKI